MSLPSEELRLTPEPSSAGAILKQERERQNLSEADIIARLRVSPAQLQALEADQYARLPGETFTRGIIRGYAKLLRIDPEPVLATYDRAAPASSRPTIAVPTQNIRFGADRTGRFTRWGLALLAIGVIAGGAWLLYSSARLSAPAPVPQAENRPPAQSGTPGDVQAPPVAQTPPVAQAPAPTTGATTTGPANVGSVAGEAPGNPIGAARPGNVPGAASEPPATAASAANTLHFIFKKDSWVQVRDNTGTVIFSQLNARGTEKDVTGTPPLSLVVGNASEVRLTYQGKPIDLAQHTKVNVARFTLK
jgi:cytoskeleton protein RodZ